jgi:hypothetical protein
MVVILTVMIGRMIQLSIDQLQIQAGTSWTVLSRPGKQAQKYVDQCYASHTWAFLDCIGSHIQLEPTTWTRPQCLGDQFIMDHVAHLFGIKPIELVYLQRVRLFLGVTTLADISLSDGKTLCQWWAVVEVNENPGKPVFRFPIKNALGHQMASQPGGNGLYKCALHPLKLRYWNDPWDDGTKDASTKCGIQLWTPTTASYTCGSMDTYVCINANTDINISTDLYAYSSTACFPLDAFQYLDIYNVRFFMLANGYAKMQRSRATIPEHVREMKTMNQGVDQIEQSETSIARAIWEGKAILMGTDGSVQDPIASYSFVISISQTDVKTNVRGGGFLPPTAQYLDPYSKHPEAAALLYGLTWIQKLLCKFPNHTDTNPPPLLIPIDNNDGVVKDVHCTINAQTPLIQHPSSNPN